MQDLRVPDKLEIEIVKGDAIRQRFDIAPTDTGPELVARVFDPADNTTCGYVAVDNLVMGPSLGGTRLAPDISVQEVYGLARAMTLKNAAAMLPIGGGKSGLIGDPVLFQEHPEAKRRLIEAYAEALWTLPEYIPGPDMGTNENDMQLMYDVFTRLNGKPYHGRGGVGRPPDKGGLPLDEWGLTAHGLFAAACTLEKRDPAFRIADARVIVQGYGNVGAALARKLAGAGARIVGVSDIHAGLYRADGLDLDELDRIRFAKGGLGAYAAPLDRQYGSDALERLLEEPCDILAPAARPDAITDRNRAAIQARFILQGANNPVRPDTEAWLARERGAVNLTDFIVNAGGVIACAVELQMDADADFRRRVLAEDGCGRAYMEQLVYRIVSANVEAIRDRLEADPALLWRDAALALAKARLADGPDKNRNSLVL